MYTLAPIIYISDKQVPTGKGNKTLFRFINICTACELFLCNLCFQTVEYLIILDI